MGRSGEKGDLEVDRDGAGGGVLCLGTENEVRRSGWFYCGDGAGPQGAVRSDSWCPSMLLVDPGAGRRQRGALCLAHRLRGLGGPRVLG